MKLLRLLIGTVPVLFSPLATAQDPPEKSRVLCDVQDPANRCPGEFCVCAEDSLEITFDGMSDSIYEYETFEPGMPLEVTVVMDVKSPLVRAWSYGVAHDPGALTILNATIEGTDLVPLLSESFVATSKDEVQTCGANLDCDPANRTEGGGWISAVIPSTTQAVYLPVTRTTIARASYILERDVGETGTLLQFTDRLARRKSPPVSYNLTIGHLTVRGRLWTTIVDGWVKRAGTCGEGVPFIRGDVGTSKPGEGYGADKVLEIGDALRILRALFLDAEIVFDCEKAADVDDDGEITLGDAVRLLLYLFLGASEPPAPFGIPGLDDTPDDLTCCSYPA